MMNLESDCKLIDAERLRLTNEIKDIQVNRQDLEKLLQQANVQIAEQGKCRKFGVTDRHNNNRREVIRQNVL